MQATKIAAYKMQRVFYKNNKKSLFLKYAHKVSRKFLLFYVETIKKIVSIIFCVALYAKFIAQKAKGVEHQDGVQVRVGFPSPIAVGRRRV